jgi:hypothetical protein
MLSNPVLMNLAEEYIDFRHSWRNSYPFRAWTVAAPTISVTIVAGGLLGMLYTAYTDLYAVLFGLGVILTGILMIIGGALLTGFWLYKRR